MILAVPREAALEERRVALVPETVSKLTKSGVTVKVARGAGERAAFPDEFYERAGASIVDDPAVLLSDADVVACVGRPTDASVAAMRKGAAVIGFLAPLADPEYVSHLASAGVTAFAMEMIPRITRAQSMDALSSQNNIAGYKAVLIAAMHLPKFFPMLTTAAGTIRPAKVLVIGAGVAGLQAIATARRLGAVVSGYDVRAVAKEQVQSLGASFLEFDVADAEGSGGYAKELTPEQQAAQQQFMVEQIGRNDVVITTALVPGKRAPILVSADAVAAMAPGSVIVDLAAEAGGNCAATQRDQTIVTANGVTVVGQTNIPSTMPYDASQLYSRNVFALLTPMIRDGAFAPDFDDEIVRGACVARDGNAVVGGVKA
jgi:NAD(P) transhydrogenase subunit alpha